MQTKAESPAVVLVRVIDPGPKDNVFILCTEVEFHTERSFAVPTKKYADWKKTTLYKSTDAERVIDIKRQRLGLVKVKRERGSWFSS